jgi:hypothetical protein
MAKQAALDPLGEVVRAMESGVGQVIPIVGEEMLTVPTEGGVQLYYHLLAERLAGELVDADIPSLPSGYNLNDVIWSQPGFRGDTTLEQDAVIRLLAEMDTPVPEPLLRLAGIDAFRLFVSTTVDSLLERALETVRGSAPAVITFPANSSLTDCPEDLLACHSAVVFRMLGRCPSSEFAITEGQVLAHVHKLLTGVNRPLDILDALQSRHLLLLGVGFPDWLGRFLVRSMRPKSLWDFRFVHRLLESGPASGHPQPALFVHRDNPRSSQLFVDRTAIQFVDEVAERWQRSSVRGKPKPPPITVPPRQAPLRAEPEAASAGTIFISFAGEDRPQAVRFSQCLREKGLDVWIDEEGLKAGDEFEEVIQGLVQRAAAFVALLSRTTNEDEPRWFRKEWRWALDRLPEFTGTRRKFLFPVMLEPLDPHALPLREFQDRDIAKALAGEAPPDLVEELREVQRAARRQHR